MNQREQEFEERINSLRGEGFEKLLIGRRRKKEETQQSHHPWCRPVQISLAHIVFMFFCFLTWTGMTKSAPGTARKLEWTSVSSRSSTRHFLPVSSGWWGPNNLTCLFSSDDDSLRVFRGIPNGSFVNKQQHIIRKLSTNVSHALSISEFLLPSSSSSSSTNLPLRGSTWR